MYSIVVGAAVSQNISDLVGLSVDYDSTAYPIIDTPTWKRTVIDKYIIVMKDLGVNVNIKRYHISCE